MLTSLFAPKYKIASNKAAEKLRAMVSITAAVSSQGNNKATAPKKHEGIIGTEIAVKLLVPGDIVFLSAGDMILSSVRWSQFNR